MSSTENSQNKIKRKQNKRNKKSSTERDISFSLRQAKGVYLNLIYSTWRVLSGHETPHQALNKSFQPGSQSEAFLDIEKRQ